MRGRPIILILFFLFLGQAIAVEAGNGATLDSLQKGRKLALQYCSSCHQFPEPELLSKSAWRKGVLPNMAARLGIKTDSVDYLEGKTRVEIDLLKSLNIYPEKPIISRGDWDLIQNFYESEAPENPLPQAIKSEPEALNRFSVEQLKIEGITAPKTTLLKVNEATRELFIGDAENLLYVVDGNRSMFSLPEVNSPPVAMVKRAEGIFDILCVGKVNPSDLSMGRVYEMDLNQSKWSVLIDSLPRPVDLLWADLQKDGVPDLIICNYGNNVGGLTVFEDGNPDQAQVLMNAPGTRKVEVEDFNQDGLLDVMVMACQAREKISILYNKGNGNFEEKEILNFGPAMGLSYFQLTDFNQDGHPDILLSNGDNWDYSAEHKNFHGIRIYMNDGRNNFKESWFYPQFGTVKTIAVDFDLDGDLDLASIAFYDDLDDASQRFLYFENKGNLNFEAFKLADAALGKWLTIEAADLDQDGDRDLILGSYFHSMSELSKLLLQGIKEFPQALILTNTLSGE